jgi:HK97 family phage prohead protease
MKEIKTLSFKSQGDGIEPNQFAGYANTWDYDSDGDIVQRGAFKNTLTEFLKSGFIAWQHQWDNPIGKPVDAFEDAKGLFLKAQVSDTAQGRDAMTLIKDGVVTKMSIGFKVEAYSMLSEEQGHALMGKEAWDQAIARLPWWKDGIRLITQVRLYEVSPVSVPANAGADILAAKRGSGSELSFNRHSDAVGSAVKDFLERARWKVDTRLKESRSLSDAQREEILAITTDLDGLCGEFKKLLGAGHEVDNQSEAIAQLARLSALDARLNGVAV